MSTNVRFKIAAAALSLMLSGAGCNFRESGSGPATEVGGLASEITGNHGHELRVPPEDFAAPDAGASYSYSIKGKAPHDHTVVFTGQQLIIVSGFNSATVASSATEGHTHQVTLDVGSP